MVLFLIATLVLSIVGMGSLLWLKHYELSTGRVIFASARPMVGDFLHGAYVAFNHVLPALLRELISRGYRSSKAIFLRGLAYAIITLEGWLERVLRVVREKTTAPVHHGEVSPFLREVAEHKKQLQENSPEDRFIVE